MGKVLGGVFVGVFVSVLAIELLGKAKPEPGWLRRARGMLKKGMAAAKEAFMEGYSAQST